MKRNVMETVWQQRWSTGVLRNSEKESCGVVVSEQNGKESLQSLMRLCLWANCWYRERLALNNLHRAKPFRTLEIDLVAGVTGSPTEDAKPCCSSCHNQNHCGGPISGALVVGDMCNSSYMGLLTSSVHLRVWNWLLKDCYTYKVKHMARKIENCCVLIHINKTIIGGSVTVVDRDSDTLASHWEINSTWPKHLRFR